MVWQKAPDKPLLREGNVDIWCFDKDLSTHHSKSLFGFLSENEKHRATQYVFNEDRDCYIFRRGILRNILSKYVQIDPQHLQINYSEYGKPYLHNAPYLQFNLSHSNEIILYAIARDVSVGIDVESLRNEIDIVGIAPLICSFRDQQVLKNIATKEQQRSAFLEIWTRKEASLKAQGLGLSHLSKLDQESCFFFHTFEFQDSIATLCCASDIININYWKI